MKSPTSRAALARMVSRGEGVALEFKRSTGELRDAMRTVCAFLNGHGGLVLFGVRPEGQIEGQQVSDSTLRDVAQQLDRFEPPVALQPERLRVGGGREVLVLRVEPVGDAMPFTYDGRPYERVASTTRVMAQPAYEALLLERMHSRQRWENQPAGVTVRDIDGEEVRRLVRAARAAGRLAGPAGRSVPEILARLGLRVGGRILRAAVVLFGRNFLPDYPQCELRMARFRGTDKTEFMDQKQLRTGAFQLLEEASVFCQRHLPVGARIVAGRLRRVESHLIPPEGLREILANAFMHRDYSIAGGAVSLAIYDDRLEIWSQGGLPRGITPDSLRHEHASVPRNPLIAEVFHRAGYVERWGRGTNRVIEMCRQAGTPEPEFAEIAGAAVVRFRVKVGVTPRVARQDEPQATPQVTPHVTPQVTPHVTPQVRALLRAARRASRRDELQAAAGIRDREHFRLAYLEMLLKAGLLERTIPDKPRSRNQRYRLTRAGARLLARRRK